MRIPRPGEVRKALAAAAAAVAVGTAAGIIEGEWEDWVTGLIGMAVAYVTVYATPANDPPGASGAAAPPRS